MLVGLIILALTFKAFIVPQQKSVKPKDKKETVEEELTMYRDEDGNTCSLKYNPLTKKVGEQIFEKE